MTLDPIVAEHQLRDWYRVPEDMVGQVVWSIKRVGSLQREVQQLREWIAHLEQHVPPEVARPPLPQTNYGHRSQWE